MLSCPGMPWQSSKEDWSPFPDTWLKEGHLIHDEQALRPPPPGTTLVDRTSGGGFGVNQTEYQRLRRQLDEELRAGMEMLQAGHRTKVEALDARWQEESEPIPASRAPEPREEEPS